MIYKRAFVDYTGNIVLDRSSGSVIAISTAFAVYKEDSLRVSVMYDTVGDGRHVISPSHARNPTKN